MLRAYRLSGRHARKGPCTTGRSVARGIPTIRDAIQRQHRELRQRLAPLSTRVGQPKIVPCNCKNTLRNDYEKTIRKCPTNCIRIRKPGIRRGAERAKNEFPRGSHVKHSETCVRGVVYGYARFQSDVMLKIADDKGMYPTRISVKYAKKLSKDYENSIPAAQKSITK